MKKIYLILFALFFSSSLAYSDELQEVKETVTNLTSQYYLTPEQVEAQFPSAVRTTSNGLLTITVELSVEQVTLIFSYTVLKFEDNDQYQLKEVRKRDINQDGFDLSFYANGKHNTYTECKNGLPDGIYFKSFSSGAHNILSHFTAGQFIGEATQWDEQGNVVQSIIYDQPTIHQWKGPPGTNPTN
jgi:hypothetical protein